MMEGSPPYKGEPLALFIRCPKCLSRYLVWCASFDPQRTSEQAGDYVFVDSRKQSVINCQCAEMLPLTEILSAEGVM